MHLFPSKDWKYCHFEVLDACPDDLTYDDPYWATLPNLIDGTSGRIKVKTRMSKPCKIVIVFDANDGFRHKVVLDDLIDWDIDRKQYKELGYICDHVILTFGDGLRLKIS